MSDTEAEVSTEPPVEISSDPPTSQQHDAIEDTEPKLPGGEADEIVQESPQEDLEDAQPEKSEEELCIEAEKAAEELKRAQEEALALVVQRLWRGHKARTLAKELRTKAMFDAMQAAAAAQGPKLSHATAGRAKAQGGRRPPTRGAPRAGATFETELSPAGTSALTESTSVDTETQGDAPSSTGQLPSVPRAVRTESGAVLLHFDPTQVKLKRRATLNTPLEAPPTETSSEDAPIVPLVQLRKVTPAPAGEIKADNTSSNAPVSALPSALHLRRASLGFTQPVVNKSSSLGSVPSPRSSQPEAGPAPDLPLSAVPAPLSKSTPKPPIALPKLSPVLPRASSADGIPLPSPNSPNRPPPPTPPPVAALPPAALPPPIPTANSPRPTSLPPPLPSASPPLPSAPPPEPITSSTPEPGRKLKKKASTKDTSKKLVSSSSAGALPPALVPIEGVEQEKAKKKKAKVSSRLSDKLKARPDRSALVEKGLLRAEDYADAALPPPVAVSSTRSKSPEKKPKKGPSSPAKTKSKTLPPNTILPPAIPPPISALPPPPPLADSEVAGPSPLASPPPPLATPPAVPKDRTKTSKSPSSRKLKSSSLTSSQVSSLNLSGSLPPPISTPPPPPIASIPAPIVPIAKEKKTKVKSKLSEKLKARPKRDELVAKGLLQADAYAESALPPPPPLSGPPPSLPPPLAAVSPSSPKREKKVSNK